MSRFFAAFLATLLCVLNVTAATTVLDDSFADGNSQNQVLPSNSAWLFNGRSVNTRTDTTGSVSFALISASSEGFWSHFTDSGSPITLAVGDTLTVSMSFSISGLVGTGQDVRFGVFNTGTTRNSANLTGGMNSSAFSDDTAYALQFYASGTGSPFVAYKRVAPGTAGITAAANPFNTLAATDWSQLTTSASGASARTALANGTSYTLTYSIQRQDENNTVITASVSGGALPAGYNWTATDTSAPYSSFDCFAFRIGGSTFSTGISFTNLKVLYTPALPVITAQPTFTGGGTSLTVGIGGQATLSVTATGSALTYHWLKDGNPVSGATSASLTLSNLQLADTGAYSVVVSNGGGDVPTSAIALTVSSGPVNQPPVISTPPASQAVVNGANVTLSVTATGNALTYLWHKNTIAIPGATASSLALTGIQPSQAGSYTVTVSNDGGSVTSSAAIVAVLSPVLTTSSVSPLTSATAINPDTPLRLTFASAPTFGTAGTIKIYDAASDTVVDTIDVSSPSVTGNASYLTGTPYQNKSIGGLANFNYYPVVISASTATIYPRNGTLAYNKTYYVRIDRGAFKDAQGDFAGINDTTTWRFSTKAAAPALGTIITVAADGSGDFNTVQGALDFIPAGNSTARTITIKNGTYFEQVYFSGKNNLTLLGQDATQTIIAYPNNNTFNNVSGVYHRGTFYGNSVSGLALINLGIHNTTPQNGSQAEALIITGSATTGKNLLSHVRLFSYQDTLQLNGQCYITDSTIEGDVDFLWGNGPAFFNNCDFKILRTGGYFAQVRNGSGNHGFVFNNSRFTATAGITGTFFNRIDPNSGQYPYSEMVLLNSVIGDATNNSFLNTTVGASGSNFQAGWWLLNNVTTDVSATTAASIHNWDNGSVDKDGTALTFGGGSRPLFTVMPADSATLANYASAYWVLNTTQNGGATAGTWTPAFAPHFLTHPVSASINYGQPAIFTVATTALPAATFQWKKNNVDIPGATSATYSIASASTLDFGAYTVVATNTSGSTTSSTAVLSMIDTYSAFLAASGISDSTAAPAGADNDGDGVSNLLEFVLNGNINNSDQAPAPLVSMVSSGSTHTLILDFVRRKDAAFVETLVQFSTDLINWTNALPGQNGVTATVTSLNGTTESVIYQIPSTSSRAFARLRATTDLEPTLTASPSSQSLLPGGGTVLTTTASGLGPITYQWYKDGAAIPGATSSTFVLNNVTASDAGSYTVTATNWAGSALSTVAIVDIAASSLPPVRTFALEGFASLGGVTGGGAVDFANPGANYVIIDSSTVNTAQTLKTYLESTTAYVIELRTDIDLAPLNNVSNKPKYPAWLGVTSMGIVKPKSNKTLFSVTGATLRHGIIEISGQSNIMIRNLKFRGLWEWDDASAGGYKIQDWDYIRVQDDAFNIWIDHCDLEKSYDGLVDIKQGASQVTVSWSRLSGDNEGVAQSMINHLEALYQANPSNAAIAYYASQRATKSVATILALEIPQDKCNLLGAGDPATMSEPGYSNDPQTLEDGGRLNVTFHHVWYRGIRQRQPRLRYGNGHMYNNYLDESSLVGTGVSSVGLAVTTNAVMLGENIYFREVTTPLSVNTTTFPARALAQAGGVWIKNGADISATLNSQSGVTSPASLVWNAPRSGDALATTWTNLAQLPYTYTLDPVTFTKDNPAYTGTIVPSNDTDRSTLRTYLVTTTP